MEKKKIKEVLILTDERPFYMDKYAWFTYEDGTDIVMLYDDAVKYLQKYSLLNRFRNADSLFASFKTKVTTLDEFRKHDVRFYDKRRLIDEAKRQKEDDSKEIETRLGIRMNDLSSLYWLKQDTESDMILAMYEKIKRTILEECQRSGISYEKDHKKIIGRVLEVLKQTEYHADEYPANQEELESIYQRKIERAKSSTAENKLYDYTSVEHDFINLKMSMVEYSADMFTASYQLINALVDRKHPKRKEILASWAEFMLVLPEYISLVNKVEEYGSKALNEKMYADIERFHSNSDFMKNLELLMTHDPEKEVYRYHATPSLQTGLKILENGLFLSSNDLDSTSFAEFSIDNVLTYSYGSFFLTVGDYIIVFREPVGEDIVREATEEEKKNNHIASRRISTSEPINDYVVDKKYMVGLIDRVNQKVYRVNQEVILGDRAEEMSSGHKTL